MDGEALRGPGEQRVPLHDGLLIGRSPECGVLLADPSVSRRHAQVRGSAGRWFLEDLGSRNGTRVNGSVLAYGSPHPIRHDDQVSVGLVALQVVSTAEATDSDRTDSLQLERDPRVLGLSAFQLDVVRCLAEPWAAGGVPAGNADIAAQLGTPAAQESVKAALRRVYAKTGLTQLPARSKRTELCRYARQHGWL